MKTKQTGYQDEEFLLSQFSAADQQAFAHIFTLFYAPLCFFCTRLVGDKPAAEEIVQDILHKLWEKNHDFSSLVSIKAFLYISTRNASMNYIDKHQRKAKRELSFYNNLEQAEEPVIREIIYNEVLNELRKEINKLPEQCRNVIRMLYEEDMKPQEIADELNIKVSTVYNQKMRGISILKAKFSGAIFDMLMLYLLFNKMD